MHNISILIAPSQITNTRISNHVIRVSSKTITLEWTLPSNPSLRAEYYELAFVPNLTLQVLPRITSPLVNVTIQPFTLYNITIISINCKGTASTVVEIGTLLCVATQYEIRDFLQGIKCK